MTWIIAQQFDGKTQWECDLCGQVTAPTALPPEKIYHACKSRGLGDTIAKAAAAIGFAKCGGCKDRQTKLNKAVPYK